MICVALPLGLKVLNCVVKIVFVRMAFVDIVDDILLLIFSVFIESGDLPFE